MKNYTDLIEVIKAKLETLTISGETVFTNVYKGTEAQPEGYPCAFVSETIGAGHILDTARNEREWQFEVALMQEMSKAGKDPDAAATLMRKITDAVIEMFDQDPQLESPPGTWNCKRVIVVPIFFDYTLREQPAYFARFTVACVDVVNNFV